MPPSKSQAQKRKRAATAPTRGRPANRSSEETRALIIAQAQEIFGQRGYEAVTLKAIADACNLNVRALAYYFPSKRDLFEAAAKEAVDRIGLEILTDVFGESRPGPRIDGYVEAFRQIHAADPKLLGFLGTLIVEYRATGAASSSLLDSTSPDHPLRDHLGAFQAFLDQFIDEGVAAGEMSPGADRTGTTLLLMAIGLGMCMVSLGDPDEVPVMLDALDLLYHGDLFTIDERRPTPAPSERAKSAKGPAKRTRRT